MTLRKELEAAETQLRGMQSLEALLNGTLLLLKQ